MLLDKAEKRGDVANLSNLRENPAGSGLFIDI
jgi:hypothetical protein